MRHTGLDVLSSALCIASGSSLVVDADTVSLVVASRRAAAASTELIHPVHIYVSVKPA